MERAPQTFSLLFLQDQWRERLKRFLYSSYRDNGESASNVFFTLPTDQWRERLKRFLYSSYRTNGESASNVFFTLPTGPMERASQTFSLLFLQDQWRERLKRFLYSSYRTNGESVSNVFFTLPTGPMERASQTFSLLFLQDQWRERLKRFLYSSYRDNGESTSKWRERSKSKDVYTSLQTHRLARSSRISQQPRKQLPINRHEAVLPWISVPFFPQINVTYLHLPWLVPGLQA